VVGLCPRAPRHRLAVAGVAPPPQLAVRCRPSPSPPGRVTSACAPRSWTFRCESRAFWGTLAPAPQRAAARRRASLAASRFPPLPRSRSTCAAGFPSDGHRLP
jgi:hypothetical protein